MPHNVQPLQGIQTINSYPHWNEKEFIKSLYVYCISNIKWGNIKEKIEIYSNGNKLGKTGGKLLFYILQS